MVLFIFRAPVGLVGGDWTRTGLIRPPFPFSCSLSPVAILLVTFPITVLQLLHWTTLYFLLAHTWSSPHWATRLIEAKVFVCSYQLCLQVVSRRLSCDKPMDGAIQKKKKRHKKHPPPRRGAAECGRLVQHY